jgi:hypothetical protein
MMTIKEWAADYRRIDEAEALRWTSQLWLRGSTNFGRIRP